jgi:protein-L-isoaspartate(D-aspartate) O-methyltransferase
MRAFNQQAGSARRPAGIFGLDLYSLHRSAKAVIRYLEGVDPRLAEIARERYGCLAPWKAHPAAYGRATLTGAYRSCADDVSRVLTEMLASDLAAQPTLPDELVAAIQNAQVVKNAEAYYREMYLGSTTSWNLRDRHMFETLEMLRKARGPNTKIVVWAHNSHVGDARAAEMGAHGQLSLGQLCREELDAKCRLVGFGTHTGFVRAAADWDGPHEEKAVRPSHEESYERLLHDSGVPAFFLDLQNPEAPELQRLLATPRLERAIGVIYRPETELQSHYFHAALTDRYDDYAWIDETTAVQELDPSPVEERPREVPETFPFGV